MIRIPPHKQTDPDKKPGQIVYPITTPLGFVIQHPDKTLSDYIQRKTRQEAFNSVQQERKLSFDEWWKTQVFAGFKDDPVEYLRNVWKAAQENKP
jgi:hypothetical protein